MPKLKATYPLYLNNKPAQPNTDLAVTDKYTGEIAFRTALATPDIIEEGIAGAVRAAEPMARLPAYERQNVLQHCVDRFRERFDELAFALCVEAGKPIKDAEGEVTRLIDTFRIAAEESVRMTGELQPLDISPRAKGYMGIWKRVPIGPCSFISPFNFPLNPAAHKIAPALAVGCPFVMKPASRTPLGALIMGEVLAETDLPRGAFSILPAHREGADHRAGDEQPERPAPADDIAEADLNPVIVSAHGAIAVDARFILADSPAPATAHKGRDPLEEFRPLFEPKTIAVLGASTKEIAIANTFIRRLKEFGYAGQIYPIHPQATEIEGLPAYPSIAEAPGSTYSATTVQPRAATQFAVCAR